MTIERLTGVKMGQRQALEIVKQCAIGFDSFYIETSISAKIEELSKVPIMVLTTDGKGVVMRFSGLEGGNEKTPRQYQSKAETPLI